MIVSHFFTSKQLIYVAVVSGSFLIIIIFDVEKCALNEESTVNFINIIVSEKKFNIFQNRIFIKPFDK